MRNKKPLNVRCDIDGHVWTAAYLPMMMREVAEIMKALRCPMCGADAKKIRMEETKNA